MRVSGVLAAGAGPRAGEGSAPILPVQAGRLEFSGGRCERELRVRLVDEGIHAPSGTRIEIGGRWVQAPPPVVRSPWPQRPVYAGFVLADSVTVLGPAGWMEHPLLRLRGATETRLRALFPRHDSLAEALFLGRRERMDPALRDRFTRSGLVHLLAISGTHVGLLASAVLILGSVARLSRRRMTWLTLGSMWVYLAMIGAPPSALRAGLMLSLALLAMLTQRPSAAAPKVAAAALALLVLDPLNVLDPGFQLSFAGVGGILIVHRTLTPLVPVTWKERTAVRWLTDSSIVSMAAFIATAPITAHHFGSVAPVALLANLPALPVMSLALVGVLAASALSLVSYPLAGLAANGAALALDLLDWIAAVMADLPLAHLEVHRPDWAVWGISLTAGLGALHLAPRMRRTVRLSLMGGIAAAVVLVWPTLARGAGGALEIHFLDVGQGDATAIRTPRGRWVLIDAGPREREYDAGARRVVPFLRSRGARTVEVMILTHPHLDHIGGAPAVLQMLRTRNVIDPGLATASPVYLEVLESIEQTGARWIAARTGRSIQIDGVDLDLLWPDAGELAVVTDPNQISAIVRVRYGEFAALLTGDAGDEVERLLVQRHGDELRAQVLKLGHHGSSTSTSSALLQAVQPELAVVSAGARNRYGHPSPVVLRRVEAAGIEIARTDLEGAVHLRVETSGARRWRRILP